MRQDAACEIGPDLRLDEAHDGRARRPSAFEERFAVVSHHAMQERRLGRVTFVANDTGFTGTGLEFCPVRKTNAERGSTPKTSAKSTSNAAGARPTLRVRLSRGRHLLRAPEVRTGSSGHALSVNAKPLRRLETRLGNPR